MRTRNTILIALIPSFLVLLLGNFYLSMKKTTAQCRKDTPGHIKGLTDLCAIGGNIC